MITRKPNISIELNPHYKPDEISVQCGSQVYANLPVSLEDTLRPLEDGGRVTWRVQVQKKTSGRLFQVHLKEGKAILRPYKNKAGAFLSYAEAREIGDKLLGTGLFDRMVVSEDHFAPGAIDGT